MKSKNQKVSEMLDLWGVFVFSYAAFIKHLIFYCCNEPDTFPFITLLCTENLARSPLSKIPLTTPPVCAIVYHIGNEVLPWAS